MLVVVCMCSWMTCRQSWSISRRTREAVLEPGRDSGERKRPFKRGEGRREGEREGELLIFGIGRLW